MIEKRIKACFMRGGTSNAVMFRREDLPADRRDWDEIFLGVMGSPDPNGRQLDGMGGGVSSLSKVCVIEPSARADADVDYTFAQIGIDVASVDFSGNCGNMSSAVGPFAVVEGMVDAPRGDEAVVRIFNTNTSKIIVSRFPIVDGQPAADGEMAIDGVSGAAAPIRLEFLDPGGAGTGKLLPTGAAVFTLDAPETGRIEISMIDAANPCVFVAAEAVGKTGLESPQELESDPEFLDRMEAIRQHASVRMGISPDLAGAAEMTSIPMVGMVAAPADAARLDGTPLPASEMTICARMISVGQPHRAFPVTGALCLAVAVRISGSIPHAVARQGDAQIGIGHPSGVTVVDAKVDHGGAEGPTAQYAAVYRTARRLFEGAALYRAR